MSIAEFLGKTGCLADERIAPNIGRDTRRAIFCTIGEPRRELQPVMDSRQTIGFFLHHGVALATQRLKRGSVEHGDLTSRVVDHAELKQSAGGLCDALAAYAQDRGEHLLGHSDLSARQTIEAQQQTATKSLVNRMM